MVREIQLTRGKVAVVDDEDYERLSAFKWTAQEASSGTGFYAFRYSKGGREKRRRIYMHNEVCPAPAGMEPDHQNQNKLDNRRQNLRIATRSQNCGNRGPSKNNTSGFKGVCWHRRNKRWQATIHAHGKCRYLGYFPSAEDAARAYDAAAVEVFGEFARLNFPEKDV